MASIISALDNRLIAFNSKVKKMKIYYYKAPFGNIGDDLNPWLWPKLLPNIFNGYVYHGDLRNDNNTDPIFIGIGTLLNEHIPKNCKKAVFGTGAGYDTPTKPTNAKFYSVRGPLTAAKLGLDPKVAITDGAALIATLERVQLNIKYKVSLMPHHGSSEESNRWKTISERLNINYIDPSNEPEIVIKEILQSEVVLTEAMHGAILADTLRVPWIPYMTSHARHEFKWQDWCASLDLKYEPVRLPPLYKSISLKSKLTNYIKQETNFLRIKNTLINNKRYLSSDSIFFRKVQNLQEKVDEFKYDFSKGLFDKP